MTTQAPFELRGRVEAVLVAHRFGDTTSAPVPKIKLLRGHGVKGDNHAGVRLADARERDLLAMGLLKGMEVANVREFSAVSVEELAEIALGLGIPRIDHGCLGENLVLSGVPRLTRLPPGAMLFFRKGTALRTAVLAVWGENTPCIAPGEAIQVRNPGIPGLASRFPKVAGGKRGVVGLVYASGFVQAGDEVVVRVPAQSIYDPLTP